MLISIIIPFYNELELIDRAISSVANQKIPNLNVSLEIILINDGNHTEDEIRRALSLGSNKAILYLKNNGDHGAGPARNAGIDVSSGSYIAFLDADDFWLSNKLLFQIPLIYKGFNFVTCAYAFESHGNVVTPPKRIISSIDFLMKLSVGTSTVIISRDLVSFFRFTKANFCQDTQLWAKIFSLSSVSYASCNEALVVYSQSTRTANKFNQAISFWCILNSLEIHSLWSKSIIFFRYMLRGLKNHYLVRFL
jgi:teichuronic acid biosynthesis glycosyltransferase TuaG